MNLKTSFKLTAVLTILCCFMFSCQDDEFKEQINNSTSKFIIKKMNTEQVNANKEIALKIEKLKPNYSSASNKDIYIESLGFSINTDDVKYVLNTETQLHSYNFPITRENSQTNNIENLLLALNTNGEYSAYIVTYDFTKEEYLNFNEGSTISKATKYIPIDFDTSVFTDGELSNKLVASYDCVDLYDWTKVPNDQGNLNGDTPLWTWEWVVTSSYCTWNIYDDGTGGGNGDSEGGYEGTGETGDGGLGTGNNPNNPDLNDYDPSNPDLHGNGNEDDGGISSSPAVEDADDDCDTSKEDLKKIFPSASEADRKTLASVINDKGKDFGIDTKEKLNHFLSQAGHETGNFANGIAIEENLNYTTKARLIKIFPSYFSLTDTTGKKKNPATYVSNPSKIGNHVYANRIGNGNTASGDGYKYRGRGVFQLTGKENYTTFKTWYNNKYNPDKDFVTSPGLIKSNDTLAIISALWYYKKRVLDKITIDTSTTVKAVTKSVNGGDNGLPDRKALYKKAKDSITCQ